MFKWGVPLVFKWGYPLVKHRPALSIVFMTDVVLGNMDVRYLIK